MKVLITGGTGYIGSHTIIDFIENDYNDIVSIDAYLNSDENTINRSKEITGKTIENHNINLTDTVAVNTFFDNQTDIDGIIHFAAFKAVGESQEFPLKYYINNIQGLTNLLENCAKHNINNFIFSSSCTVYGQPDTLPVNEDCPIKVAESVYGNTKQIGEEIIRDFSNAHPKFKAILLRYFNPIGAHISGKNGELPEGIPNNLVPFITQSAIGKRGPLSVFGNDYKTRDGSCIRDYIHVSDIAHAHTLGLKRLIDNKSKEQIEVFNLGTGNGVTVLEAIKAFEEATGVNLNYEIKGRRPGDVEAVYADATKAAEELNWKPKFSLHDSMLSAWKWEQDL